MIKVKRPKLPDIKVYKDKKFNLTKEVREILISLIKPTSSRYGSFINRLKDKDERFTKAEQETLASIAYYANPKNFKDNKKLTTKKGPTFNVYKDKDLKELLSTAFNKKCAYCESKFLQVSPADIEHFRPKAAINPFAKNKDEKLIVPGYYWLAADWDNLLWSCILCNRKNNLEEAAGEGPQPLGKKNRFPVLDESKRIRSHNDDLKKEQKFMLILDPCKDDPEKHLYFPLEGDDLGIIKSVLKNNKPSPKGEASIPLYGLNRVELVFARREEALDLRAIFIGMLRSLESFIRKRKANEDATAEEKDFQEQKSRFQAKMAPSAEYLGMKKYLLEDFNKIDLVRKLNLKVEDLLKN